MSSSLKGLFSLFCYFFIALTPSHAQQKEWCKSILSQALEDTGCEVFGTKLLCQDSTMGDNFGFDLQDVEIVIVSDRSTRVLDVFLECSQRLGCIERFRESGVRSILEVGLVYGDVNPTNLAQVTISLPSAMGRRFQQCDD